MKNLKYSLLLAALFSFTACSHQENNADNEVLSTNSSYQLILPIDHSGGNIDKATLEKLTNGNLVVKDIKTGATYPVTSFNLECFPKGKDVEVATSESDQFTSEMNELINNAKQGDMYFLQKVHFLKGDMPHKVPRNGLIALKVE